MIKKIFILLTVSAVSLALGDSKTHFSKKNTFQAPTQYASVASFHSTKTSQRAPSRVEPQRASAQPVIQQAPIQPVIQQAPIQSEAPRAPSPYSFNYEAEGSSRTESSDASGKVKGSYKVTNEDGSVRIVNYVADEYGFRADIDTNEPGTKSDNPANVVLKSAAVEKKYEAPKKQATQSFSQKTTKTHHEQKPVMFNLGRHQSSNGQASTFQQQTHQAKQYAPTPFKQERIQQTQFSDTKPIPYSFSYDAQLDDGSSSRSESSDASGKVTGSYSLAGADGRKRIINYEADHEGFRASVDTNEFGTRSDSPANVQFLSSAPQEAPVSHSSKKSAASSFGQKTAPVAAFSPKTSPATSFSQKTAGAAAFPVQQLKISSGSSIKTAFQAPTMYQGQSSIQYNSAAEEKPEPYSFNYAADLDDGSISRSESADGSGKVVGSYSLSVADGRQRKVDYFADHDGFRATVNTNEFGTKEESPADVQFYSSATLDEPAPYSSPNAYKASSSASMYSSSHAQQQPIQFSMGDGNGAYSYSYQSSLEDGGSNAHSESSDGSGKISGYYSLSNAEGMRRKVDYTAGNEGFQASIDTNEYGTKSDSPAHVTFLSSAPQVAPAEAPRAPVAFMAPATHQASGSVDMYKTSYVSQQQVEPVQSFQPSPYAFNYEAEASGGSSSRKESSDGNGVVTGSYEVRNEDGSVRVVEYIADENGFRANVKTNEAGTKSDHPADVIFKSDAPAPVAPLEQKSLKPDFPAPSFSRKSSEFSQTSIDAFE